MSRPFCFAPFSSFSHKPEGYRPCCSRHAKPVPLTTEDWWNSEYLRKFRMAQFSLDTLPEECKLCLAKGDNGGHKYSHEVMSKNYNRNTGEMSVPPSQVYVFTGTKCDLACQMCDSSFSDTHARVFPDRIIPIVDVSVDKPLHIVNRYPGVQLVVYGGEPFLAKETYDIVKLGLLKGDLISFLSNGNRSYRNNRIFQELILPNPDRFSVCISIDGYPSLNEKIRVNARQARLRRRRARPRRRAREPPRQGEDRVGTRRGEVARPGLTSPQPRTRHAERPAILHTGRSRMLSSASRPHGPRS
jgi:hypothetical protein